VVALLVWTQLVTVARTVRWPNDFSEAHWLLDYRYGLVKRGLVGQSLSLILSPLGIEPGERLIATLGMLAFALLCGVLLMVGLRIIRDAGWSPTSVLVTLAFLSSPFTVMSAHLVGYFDHLLVILTVVAAVLLGRGYVWTGATVQALAVFVHEAALVFGLPILAMAWLLMRDEARRQGRPAPMIWPLALPVAAFVFLALSPGLLLSPDFQDLFARRLATFPWVGGDMYVLVPEWLAPGGLAALTAQSHRFVERVVFPEAWTLVLPTSAVLFGYVIARYGRTSAHIIPAAFALAILAPVVMHLAAWDTIRIWTWSIGTAWLGVWVHSRSSLPVRDVTAVVSWAALVAVGINVLLTTPLLDAQVDRLSIQLRVLLYAPTFVGGLLLIGSFVRGRDLAR
jgi:hypothetical protein